MSDFLHTTTLDGFLHDSFSEIDYSGANRERMIRELRTFGISNDVIKVLTSGTTRKNPPEENRKLEARYLQFYLDMYRKWGVEFITDANRQGTFIGWDYDTRKSFQKQQNETAAQSGQDYTDLPNRGIFNSLEEEEGVNPAIIGLTLAGLGVGSALIYRIFFKKRK